MYGTRWLEPSVCSPTPTIAIDLTPILPGGYNGGAKIFILDLIRGLARVTPQVEFVLLTQEASHEELASLDCKNVRRVQVVTTHGLSGNRGRVRRTFSSMAKSLRPYFKSHLAKGSHQIRGLLRRFGGSQILRQIGANLLFCPFTAPTYFNPRIPMVCTVYDLQFATYPQFFSPEEVVFRKCNFLDACRKASILVAISDYSRDSAIAYGNLAPSQIKTIALRMAKRLPCSTSGASTTMTRLALARQRYILYPANFWEHKNHEKLLAAFGMACDLGLPPDIKLVCTGAPSARMEFVQNAAVSLCIEPRVVLPGYLTDADLSDVLQNAGGVVFPSLFEGFGLPIIEAMAAGVPVACSDVTSLPEVAGNAALFFDPGKPSEIAQAMIRLMGDPALRSRLIEIGYRQAAKYSDVDRMVSEYRDLFESLLCCQEDANSSTARSGGT